MNQKMDEGNTHPQSSRGIHHHQQPVQHSRPFFYVQPPSQPYYNMYHHQHNQWHMNQPYNPYGVPGSGGYPLGRFSPYMSPYPYMQYPGGYVVPPSPHMHPVDYRRMYEPPRFHPPPGHDLMFQQQHHHQAQREMACSEVQTDPSDALNKLIECLDKLRTNEMQGSDKELDSGVISQASGIFSPDERRRKHEEEEQEVVVDSMHSEALLHGKLEGGHLQSSSPMARLFSVNDSTAAVYGEGESSRSLGDHVHPEGWAVDEDPPLDSSSIHEANEENLELEACAPGEEDQQSHCCFSENICLLSAVSLADEEPDDQVENGNDPDAADGTQGPCYNLLSPLLPSSVTLDWGLAEDLKPKEEMLDIPDSGSKDLSELDMDLSCQIPCLPFDKVLTAGTLQKDPPASSDLQCGDLQVSLSSALLATTAASTPTHHHYYPYYCPPKPAHQRLSVLSPSLDELSSRDEMFSTDLDDLDVFPRRVVYAGRRFSETEEVCPKSKKLTCACCGSSLSKGAGSGGRVKVHHHGSKVYADDQEGDTDEVDEQKQRRPVRTFEERSHPVRVVIKKHFVPKKRQPIPLHFSCKRSQYREGLAQTEEPAEEPEMGLVDLELAHYEGESGHEAANKQHRACKEPCRREGVGAKPRWKPHSLLQERIAPRKASCNILVYQKVQDALDDDDDEDEEGPPRLHRAKGYTKRETRC
ncbi:hypothetical protein DPEC_G00079700 [Dallia pectoralis]|uniref:Uncharacterized protein n=1 Tax=Dallia pectoralis TaxID=75939 RepID=A0ACC2H4Q0_DALPE|nr:hypothetical protein DPEC_G00079700 [Dallia pectoralis]